MEIKINRNRDILYVSGVILIVLTSIFCIISFYLLIYGIPIFAIGSIFIFLSKRSLKTKLLSTLLPIVIYGPLTILFLWAYNYSTPKVIIVPKGHYGIFRVIYDQECGSSYQKAEQKDALIFSKSGLLILNEPINRHINYQCFEIDIKGKKTKIPQFLLPESNQENIPHILFGGSGTLALAIANSKSKDNGISFSDFHYSNTQLPNEIDYKRNQVLDSLTFEILRQCNDKANSKKMQ